MTMIDERRVVLVVGAAGGIGSAVCRRLAAAGAKLAALSEVVGDPLTLDARDIEGLARAAAATYATRHVRINAVAPGLVRTPPAARIVGSEASLKASEAMHALGRIGEPEDVASVIAFLMDPQHAWVTGQVFGVDGGLGTLRAR